MLTKSHHHHVHKLFHMKSTLQELYLHLVIQALAISMISIFIPVYLLQLGFSLKTVFIFLFMEWATFGMLAPLCGYIIKHTGIKEVILIRTPILVSSYFLLSLMRTNPIVQKYSIFIAVLLGFSGILYTLSISSLFAEIMHKKKGGTETGLFISMPYIGTILGPFIGAFISLTLGFHILFIIVSIILLISILPLITLKRKIDHPDFNLRDFFRQFSKYRNQILFLNLYGVKGFVHYLVIPLAIFIYNQNIIILGAISSLIAFINMIVTIKIGRLIDRKKKMTIIRTGAILTTVYLIFMAIVAHSDIFVYAALFSGILSILTGLPYEAYLYQRAKRDASPVPFLVFKEMTLFMGRIILFLSLIILAEKMHLTLYLGSAAALLIGFNTL